MLEEQIGKDYIEAMKSKDGVRSSTLSFLRAQLKNVKIDQRLEKLSDADAIAVIKKQIKQRQDSISQYEQGGRQDLAEKEKKELDILKSYLPQEMSAEQVSAVIETVIQEVGAKSVKEMGIVMKGVLAKVGGQADSKLVSELVKKRLTT
ncbi:MAG: GatB/YqeY domain-containing protein [Candidatus Omnitrophica bacterium]|nr:GatB/YqeY domain-containing protein [Candidatus Omnitrophota bacterium]